MTVTPHGCSAPSNVPVGLAPMEGVTDLATRLWFYHTSQPDFLWTPFLRVTPTHPARTRWMESFCPEILLPPIERPYPLVVQLMAADADDFCRVAEPLLSHVDFVDLNCGCPSPNAVGSGAGSSLLQDAARWRQFLQTIAMRLGPDRFSIKMRTGYADADEFPILQTALADIPVRQIAIHGRTRADRYGGQARWDLIQTAAAARPQIIVGSGDIVDCESLRLRYELAPDIQQLIIGRGALRNPWIFTEVRIGHPVLLPVEVLITSLGAFALLQSLAHQKGDGTTFPWRSVAALNPARQDPGAWQTIYEVLQTQAGIAGSPEELPLTGQTLGRVKMLWNYLRSSLPEIFFAPTLMRCKTVGDLLTGIRLIAQQGGHSPDVILRHNSQWDSLYGTRRKEDIPSSQAPMDF